MVQLKLELSAQQTCLPRVNTNPRSHALSQSGRAVIQLPLFGQCVCVCVRREEMTLKQCPLTHISTHERTQKDTHTHTHTLWPYHHGHS